MGINKRFLKKEELKITGATLLSTEEVEEFLTEEERKYSRWWWLQSPSAYPSRVAIVSSGGGIYEYGYYACIVDGAVRPALKISNLGKSNFAIGDIFRINNYEFKIISQNLAWLYKQGIGLDFFDNKSNDYEKSHIKRYIDDWFEKEIEKEV